MPGSGHSGLALVASVCVVVTDGDASVETAPPSDAATVALLAGWSVGDRDNAGVVAVLRTPEMRGVMVAVGSEAALTLASAAVGTGVAVAVLVSVAAGDSEGVGLAVRVGVGVRVGRGVAVAVRVGVGDGLGVGVGGAVLLNDAASK